jgi:hypothetical protein
MDRKRVFAAAGVVLVLSLTWFEVRRPVTPPSEVTIVAPFQASPSVADVGCVVTNLIRPSPQSFGTYGLTAA